MQVKSTLTEISEIFIEKIPYLTCRGWRVGAHAEYFFVQKDKFFNSIYYIEWYRGMETQIIFSYFFLFGWNKFVYKT